MDVGVDLPTYHGFAAKQLGSELSRHVDSLTPLTNSSRAQLARTLNVLRCVKRFRNI